MIDGCNENRRIGNGSHQCVNTANANSVWDSATYANSDLER
jgi:hypothetical protein